MATDFPLDLKDSPQTSFPNQKGWMVALLFFGALSAYFILFHHLGVRDFWSSHEARSAMDATSILEGQPLLAPTLFDGTRELQKPPLYYWLVAGISWLRNTNPDTYSVRLPSAISGALILFTVSGFLLARGKKLEAALAVLFMLSCLHFPWAARIGRTDMALSLFITVSVLFAELAKTTKGIQRFLFFSLSQLGLFLAILCKGLVGLVLAPAIILISIVYIRPNPNTCQNFYQIWRLPGAIPLLWGWLLTISISALVFYWIDQASGGEFLKTFFGYHHLTRALGNGELRSHPIWYYFYLFTIDFFPWSLWFGICLYYFLQSKDHSAEARLGLAWFGTVFLILSLASYKRSDYLLPAYPGAALFLACITSKLIWQTKAKWHTALSAIAPIGILTATAAAWVYFVDFHLPTLEPYRETRSYADRIRRETRGELVFFNLESHSLAFHCGKPLRSIVGKPNLLLHLQGVQQCFLITTPKEYEAFSDSLKGWEKAILLERTLGQTQGLSKPFILVKACRESLEGQKVQYLNNDK